MLPELHAHPEGGYVDEDEVGELRVLGHLHLVAVHPDAQVLHHILAVVLHLGIWMCWIPPKSEPGPNVVRTGPEMVRKRPGAIPDRFGTISGPVRTISGPIRTNSGPIRIDFGPIRTVFSLVFDLGGSRTAVSGKTRSSSGALGSQLLNCCHWSRREHVFSILSSSSARCGLPYPTEMVTIYKNSFQGLICYYLCWT